MHTSCYFYTYYLYAEAQNETQSTLYWLSRVCSVNSNDKHSTVSFRLIAVCEALDLSLSVSPSDVSQTPSSTGTTLACQADTDKY